MIVELSIKNSPNKLFWEKVGKPAPIYSVSESELSKALVMFSIGISTPRVRVTKVKVKLANCINTFYMKNGEAVRLFKDENGFYLEKLDWNYP